MTRTDRSLAADQSREEMLQALQCDAGFKLFNRAPLSELDQVGQHVLMDNQCSPTRDLLKSFALNGRSILPNPSAVRETAAGFFF